MEDAGEIVPCGRARRKERHVAHRWTFQAEDDSPAQAEATCPGYGEIQPVDSEQPDDLLYEAWTVIANAGGGDWTTQSDEWVTAAVRWRDRFHAHLGRSEA